MLPTIEMSHGHMARDVNNTSASKLNSVLEEQTNPSKESSTCRS